jgi:lipocalin
MDKANLIRNLEHEYCAILEANPDWNKTLAQFLLGQGMSKDDIWEHLFEIALNEGWDEPDWL